MSLSYLIVSENVYSHEKNENNLLSFWLKQNLSNNFVLMFNHQGCQQLENLTLKVEGELTVCTLGLPLETTLLISLHGKLNELALKSFPQNLHLGKSSGILDSKNVHSKCCAQMCGTSKVRCGISFFNLLLPNHEAKHSCQEMLLQKILQNQTLKL